MHPRTQILTLALILISTNLLLAQPKPGDKTAAIEALMTKLKSKKNDERVKAAQDLGKLGADAGPAARLLCETALGDIIPEVRQAALAALAKVRPDLGPHVAVLLTTKDLQKSLEAAKSIGKIGREAAPAVPALTLGMRTFDTSRKENDPAVVIACVDALAEVAPNEKDVIGQVGQTAALHKETDARVAGVRCVGKLGAAHAELRRDAVKYLAITMRDSQSAVRAASLQAAAGLGADAKTLLRTAAALEKDDNEDVRRAFAVFKAGFQK